MRFQRWIIELRQLNIIRDPIAITSTWVSVRFVCRVLRAGGAYCLLEIGLAPGMSVPRHTHTREDAAYFVLVGELEVIVGDEIFILRPGDSLMHRATSPTSCAIPARSRTTISWCPRRPGSRSF